MVARLLTGVSVLVLLVCTVSGAARRPLCLSCHPGHYADQGACIRCHRGNPASERKNIAHHMLIGGRYAGFTRPDNPVLETGNRLLEQYACRRCHVIGQQGNRLSTDLYQAVLRRAPEDLRRSIRQPVQNMPDFRCTEMQLEALVTAVLAASEQRSNSPSEKPQVVHFDRAGGTARDVFSKKCGSCHRMLTARSGALGSGNSGPNLSGLLSPFYPKTFRGVEMWNDGRLRRWLENPRSVAAGARMQPVILTAAEFRDLVAIISDVPTLQ